MVEIVQEYWLTFLIGQYPNGPLGGLALTMIIAIIGLLLSFPIGLLFALMHTSSKPWIAFIGATIVNLVRGIPLLMLIFWAYFVIPKIIGGNISGFWTLVCALVIYESAYMSEVIRAGIEALPKGQVEASKSLGAGYWLTMRKIVLPQVLFHVMPGLTSQFISTIKETSLGYVISVNELTFSANQINNMVLTKPLQVFGILAIIYFILCVGLSRAMALLDARIKRRRTYRAA